MLMTLEERELERFLGIMDTFRKIRVGVIGDLVADSYIYGVPARLSREEG